MQLQKLHFQDMAAMKIADEARAVECSYELGTIMARALDLGSATGNALADAQVGARV